MSEQTRGEQLVPAAFELRRELQESIYGLVQTQTLYVSAKLGLADLLADGPRSVDELASATRSHAPTLRRLLRYLTSRGLFDQNEQGLFSLTAKGTVFRGMTAEAIYWGDAWNWSSWTGLLESIRTGKTSFDLTHGEPLFAHLARHPGDAAVFNQYMTAMASGPFRPITELYDFSAAHRVVDVAGGHGAFLVSILQAHPTVSGVLFDLPQVVTGAQALMRSAQVGDRCELIAGDFFASVPPDGDIYILSKVLHDWDDDKCLAILRNCRQAMHSTSKLLVLELIVPDDNQPSLAKLVDVIMLALTGGTQRTEAEYVQLFESADFRLTKTIPAGLVGTIIEATPS